MTIKTAVDKIGVAPVRTCDWRGCTVFPTFRVVQWDTETQNENDVAARYMCLEHAQQVQQLVEPEPEA